MKKGIKKNILLTAATLLSFYGFSQISGDYKSVASGNWSNTATWNTFDGASWIAAVSAPASTNNVYVEATHTVTVDVNSACKDFNLSTTGVIAIGANTLQVNGKLRAFTGTAPGTSSNAPAVTSITTTTGGKLQFVGTTRNITTTGEWGANTRNCITEFALNAGQTGTFSTAFKCGDITIASGTMICNSDLRASYNADNTGTITVKSGAALRLAANVSQVGTPSATSQLANFTVESGGTLEFSNVVGYIDAATINFSGLVTYSSTSAQTLVNKPASPADGVTPSTYTDLTLQSSAKTLSLNTTVNGVLSMRTSTGNTPSVILNGNTLTYGPSAILQYRGIGTPVPAQTTADAEWPASGSSASIPPNVDIFNASMVTLNSNKAITGQLKLSGAAGITQKLILGNNNISVGSVYIPVPDAYKYVVTDGGGSLTINNVGSSPVSFPVGPTTSLYHPVTITNNGTADNFSVNVISAYPSCVTGGGNEWVNATWDISEETPGGSNCTIALDYQGAITGAGFTATNAQVFHCNGAAIDYHSTGTSVGTVVTGSAFSSFSPFGVSSDAIIVLPVRILQFSGKKTADGVSLNWNVADEQNVSGYEVQRSADATNYSTIGFVNAGRTSYNFTDRMPVKGNNFYRLRVVDTDGKSALSRVVLLPYSDMAASGIKVYPTLVTDRLFVLRTDSEPINYAIYSVYGQVLLTGNTGSSTEISVSALPSGNYFLKAGNETIKFAKQ